MNCFNTEVSSNRVIVSVIGKDRTGIIAHVSNALHDSNINILDISQTIMQDLFAMILVADMEKSSIDMANLKNKLNELGNELGVRIDAQHEDVFNFMHRI